jgi:murein DD-endopeptidase MepM/ murein hydrolase activator NlpD
MSSSSSSLVRFVRFVRFVRGSTVLRVARGGALVLASLSTTHVAAAADPFSYDPPGKLVNGSGKGRVDMNVYAPGIRFPIESGPAFANSQVWGHGGNSGTGSQCDIENFSYPWHDNYCETRDWSMPLCPSGAGHQGQDIRAASCKPGVHTTVAVVDGTITSIGSYSVYLTAADGTRFDYLHMDQLQVKEGQKVKRGDHLGKVSNLFGGEATTIHLHFNIRQNVAGVGVVYAPPYMSLVQSYDTLMNGGHAGPDAGPDAAPPTPLQEAPVTPQPVPEPPPEEPPAADTGCAFAPPSGSAPYGASFGVALGALALVIAARRRR